MLQKEDTDWVKKCIEYEVKGSRPRGRCEQFVQKDCQARNSNREDAMDPSRWKKLDDDQDGGWVNVSSGSGSPR